MNSLFGTDGIRGLANKYPLDCETMFKLGRAIAHYFGRFNKKNKIIIGWDPRVSADMIVTAIASGICSVGVDVVLAGVIPTPGISKLTVLENFSAGIVVSASHNKFYDNGVKIFNENGYKLSKTTENKLEKLIKNYDLKIQPSQNVGKIFFHPNPVEKYIDFLQASCPSSFLIKGIKVVLDCANGAMSFCAPRILKKLGAKVITIFDSPRGDNINKYCGSEYPEHLSKMVLEKGADLGLGFDGDGDRLIAITEQGEILNGDQLLSIFAQDMKNFFLKEKTIVSTIMSNTGLKFTLKKLNLRHVISEVGDRCVVEKMLEVGASIGGENSGHIVFLDHQKTGDALLASLFLLSFLKRRNISLSEASKFIKLYPQHLISVNINSKPELSNISVIQKTIKGVEKELGNKGRVLVRYSGTQPKCRIMVEGNNPQAVEKNCKLIANIIRKTLN